MENVPEIGLKYLWAEAAMQLSAKGLKLALQQ